MLLSRPLFSGTHTSRMTALCASTEAVGDIVKVTGDRVGLDYQVSKVDLATPGATPGVGVIVAKIGTTRCVVQIEGEIKGVYAGLTPGRTYFAGLDSRPSHTPPTPAVGGRAYLQTIGVALAADTLYLRPESDMKVRVG